MSYCIIRKIVREHGKQICADADCMFEMRGVERPGIGRGIDRADEDGYLLDQ
jgi:hypothetical protein